MNDTLINYGESFNASSEFTTSSNTYMDNIVFAILIVGCVAYYIVLLTILISNFVTLLKNPNFQDMATKIWVYYLFIQVIFIIFDSVSIAILVDPLYNNIKERNYIYLFFLVFKLPLSTLIFFLYLKLDEHKFVLIFFIIRCFSTGLDIWNLAKYSNITIMWLKGMVF